MYSLFISEAIKKGDFGGDSTDAQIDKLIGSWFRQSTEREKSRNKHAADLEKNIEKTSDENGSGRTQKNKTDPPTAGNSGANRDL
jgi:hypothetical protein